MLMYGECFALDAALSHQSRLHFDFFIPLVRDAPSTFKRPAFDLDETDLAGEID
ncbi:hypothetical protein BDV39DRAFT_185629 [Aspergillus sergii]|uniref:Uncharacterized protein n=1 Tax=Aspergillus sergii TaxID=1034303 RepID=A0A5N6WMR6_9EURO|nr:hypothetical protein BDV39DRAFT_185629 [Aspergillus sergii]